MFSQKFDLYRHYFKFSKLVVINQPILILNYK